MKGKVQNIWLRTLGWSGHLWQYHLPGCELLRPQSRATPGTRIRGLWPGASWEIDYTEIKPGIYRFKYLLVFINIFRMGRSLPYKGDCQHSGKEASGRHHTQVRFAYLLGSNNGPALMSQVTQSLAQALGPIENYTVHTDPRVQGR